MPAVLGSFTVACAVKGGEGRMREPPLPAVAILAYSVVEVCLSLRRERGALQRVALSEELDLRLPIYSQFALRCRGFRFCLPIGYKKVVAFQNVGPLFEILFEFRGCFFDLFYKFRDFCWYPFIFESTWSRKGFGSRNVICLLGNGPKGFFGNGFLFSRLV